MHTAFVTWPEAHNEWRRRLRKQQPDYRGDEGEPSAQYGPRLKSRQYQTTEQEARPQTKQDDPDSNHPCLPASHVPLWDCESILRCKNRLEEVAG
jgi:hypothetical protein